MTAFTNPTDIARETLKQLAMRRIAPTPDNYRDLYHSIAGTSEVDSSQLETLDRKLGAAAAALPDSEGRQRELVQRAIARRDWLSAANALLVLMEPRAQRESAGENCPVLLAQVVDALEAQHPGMTRARKREALERLLTHAERDGQPVAPRIASLIASWGSRQADTGIQSAVDPVRESAADLTATLRDCLSIALDVVLPSLLPHAPDLAWEARMLATRARQATDAEALAQVGHDLRQFTRRVELHAGGDGEVREGLLRILRLLVDNIQDLVDNDHWIQGQVAIVKNTLDGPLTPEVVEHAEKAIRDLMVKQGALKRTLDEAKENLKALLQDFIVRLAELSGDTSDYHAKLQAHSERLQRCPDVASLASVVRDLMEDTRAMQSSADQCRTALTSAREHVEAAELRIREMEHELEQLSERVREDQLTGTLNRRGLDEAFKREAGRADRQDSPMCVALLDVDNFKQLNDNLGHQAGDEALLHLVKVVRLHLRPADALARYGGEEFAILLPDTDIEEAVDVMTRLQRELTRQFFLHNNERLLITFSCGISQREAGEELEPAMARADQALYQAKRAGKNRVVAHTPRATAAG